MLERSPLARDSLLQRMLRSPGQVHKRLLRCTCPHPHPQHTRSTSAVSEGDTASQASSTTTQHSNFHITDALEGRDLFVQVVRAEHLPAADEGGTSDPYCIVRLGGGHSHRTPTMRHTCSPTWNETVMFSTAQLLQVDLLHVCMCAHVYMFFCVCVCGCHGSSEP